MSVKLSMADFGPGFLASEKTAGGGRGAGIQFCSSAGTENTVYSTTGAENTVYSTTGTEKGHTLTSISYLRPYLKTAYPLTTINITICYLFVTDYRYTNSCHIWLYIGPMSTFLAGMWM